jgi:hypothetical protein
MIPTRVACASLVAAQVERASDQGLLPESLSLFSLPCLTPARVGITSLRWQTAPIVSEQCVQSVTRSAESESGRMVMAYGVVRRTYAGTSLRVKRITAKPMATVA